MDRIERMLLGVLVHQMLVEGRNKQFILNELFTCFPDIDLQEVTKVLGDDWAGRLGIQS